MGLFHHKTPVDLERLENEIREGMQSMNPHDELPPQDYKAVFPQDYAPKSKYTRLQLIAYAITTLTWTDAVAMGQGVLATVPANEAMDLTRALQTWAAAEWKKFDDDKDQKENHQSTETSADRSSTERVYHQPPRPRGRTMGASMVSPQQDGGSRDSQA